MQRSLIEEFKENGGGMDCFEFLISNYISHTDLHSISLVNKNFNQFFHHNIHSVLCVKIASISHRYGIAKYKNDLLSDIHPEALYVLLSYFENEFPTTLMKRDFIRCFSLPEVLSINNVYFWQLVFSRLLDMMGIEHLPEKAKIQFVTSDNLSVFKNFISSMSLLNEYIAFKSRPLDGLHLGGIGSIVGNARFFEEYSSLMDALRAVDQAEICEAMKFYIHENYFDSRPVFDGGKSAENVRNDGLGRELGDLAGYFCDEDGNLSRELVCLYSEDKKKARWVIDHLKQFSLKQLRLFSSDYFNDNFDSYFLEEGNRLSLVGSVYAVSQFGSKFEPLLSKLMKCQRIKKLSSNVINNYVEKILMTMMVEAAKAHSLKEIDALLAKFSNETFQDFVITVIRNYTDNFEKCIFALLMSLKHWNFTDNNVNHYQLELVMVTADDWDLVNESKLAYIFRPDSLLWIVTNSEMIKRIMFHQVGFRKRVDHEVLILLSESRVALDRLRIIGDLAHYFNQLHTAVWNHKGTLSSLLKLPDPQFEFFVSELRNFERGLGQVNDAEWLTRLPGFMAMVNERLSSTSNPESTTDMEVDCAERAEPDDRTRQQKREREDEGYSSDEEQDQKRPKR